MDRSTALQVFDAFEQQRKTEWEGDPPAFDVRLDAGSAEVERDYRVFVRASRASGGIEPDDVQFVSDVVRGTYETLPQDEPLFVAFENSGVAIY